MANDFVQLPIAGSVGDKADAEVLVVGANTVKRERDQIAGAGADDIAVVTDTTPGGSDHGLVVRNIPSGTQAVSGPLTDAQLRATPVPISGSISATNPSVSTTGTAVPASATMIGGTDGTNLRAARTATDGTLRVDPTGTTAQPITAASLPLPTGAATEATLATRAADRTTAPAPFAARLSDGAAFYNATTPADTQPISAASLPLPALASTSTLQSTGNASLASIDTDIDVALSTRASLAVQTDGTQRTKITDGSDNVGISTVSGAKALKVDVVQSVGGGGGGSSQVDKSTFTEGATSFTAVGGVFNETISADPTEDQAAAARITAKRAVHTNLRSNAGVEIGTAGAPIRTDPTGSTTQPVSGTVTANAGTGPWPVTDNGGSLTVDGSVSITGSVAVTGGLTDAELRATAVPVSVSGVSTAANQTSGNASLTQIDANTDFGVVIGGGLEATALRVTIANDSTGLLSVDDNGGSLTVDGSVTANLGTIAGVATATQQTDGTQKSIVRGGAKGATTAADVTSTNQSADRNALDVQIRTSAGAVVDTFGGGTQFADGAARGSATGTLCMVDDGTLIQSLSGDSSGRLNVNNISGTVSLPTGAATSALQTQPGVDIGDVTVNNAGGASAVNVQDGGNSITVDGTVAATQSGTWTVQPGNTANTTAWMVREQRGATATLTNTSGSASSVTVLASNANRIGGMLYNDSSSLCYVKFGSTASSTSFTVRLGSQDYYELPFPAYSGIITAIWNSATGSMRATETTA